MGPICNLMLKGIVGEKYGQETIELLFSKIKGQDKVIKSGARLTNDYVILRAHQMQKDSRRVRLSIKDIKFI